MTAMNKRFTAVSLFTGAGGMDVRLQQHLAQHALDHANPVVLGDFLLVFAVGEAEHLHSAGLVELKFAQLDGGGADVHTQKTFVFSHVSRGFRGKEALMPGRMVRAPLSWGKGG